METIRILLVEDNLLAQKIVATVMRTLGCKVDIADDGNTALAKHNNEVYDLILMDLGLPDMDGHEVTLKIRKREKSNRHTPIVALTARVCKPICVNGHSVK